MKFILIDILELNEEGRAYFTVNVSPRTISIHCDADESYKRFRATFQ